MIFCKKKWNDLKQIINTLPYTTKKISALMGDARNIGLTDNLADLLITSPPYINVFNYHQKYRRSVEVLGFNVLSTAKTEFGSNRKNRGNRLLTVIQYCIDMALAMYESNFPPENTVTMETNIGYVLAELKTNLDKTMFQEASATAHDVKQAVTGAKYYLLCDFLDMTPISTTTTDIDEILIVRKAKRINSNIRKAFNSYEGRQAHREWYVNYLKENPYSVDMFKRFLEHILSLMTNEELIEESVLEVGYF